MFAWRQFGKTYDYMWNNFRSDQPIWQPGSIYVEPDWFDLSEYGLIKVTAIL